MSTLPENRKLEIDHDGIKNLDVSRKWAMFLSIIGFIFLGLLIVIGVIAGIFLSAFKKGSTGSGFTESLIMIIYIILAASGVLPVYFMFRFSKHAGNALNALNSKELNKAFRNLKSFFVYFGVLIIVLLALYFAVLIITGTSISLLKGMG